MVQQQRGLLCSCCAPRCSPQPSPLSPECVLQVGRHLQPRPQRHIASIMGHGRRACDLVALHHLEDILWAAGRAGRAVQWPEWRLMCRTATCPRLSPATLPRAGRRQLSTMHATIKPSRNAAELPPRTHCKRDRAASGAAAHSGWVWRMQQCVPAKPVPVTAACMRDRLWVFCALPARARHYFNAFVA